MYRYLDDATNSVDDMFRLQLLMDENGCTVKDFLAVNYVVSCVNDVD